MKYEIDPYAREAIEATMNGQYLKASLKIKDGKRRHPNNITVKWAEAYWHEKLLPYMIH